MSSSNRRRNKVETRRQRNGFNGSVEQRKFTIHGPVYRERRLSVMLTSLLHRMVPISTQNYIRDAGFRPICDGGVALAAGVSAIARPQASMRFLAAGRQRRDHRYGSHPRQVIQVLQGVRLDDGNPPAGPPKLVIFVHGGAWGSGSTWMYRLVAYRLSRLGYTVASLGYRVYPDADVSGQVDDLAAAVRWISGHTAELGLDNSPGVFLVGHSSGAHIALLYLVRRAQQEDQRHRLGAFLEAGNGEVFPDGGGDEVTNGGTSGEGRLLEVEGFVGLSGVYDVYRHYLFESWRGVHEISPLKPANGGSLHMLFQHSYPRLHQPWSVQGAKRAGSVGDAPQPARGHSSPSVASANPSPTTAPAGGGGAEASRTSPRGLDGRGGGVDRQRGRLYWEESRARLGRWLPRTLLVHGTSDTTVPFSQTAAFAAALKALGVPTTVRLEAGGDHFDTIGDLMFSEGSSVEAALLSFTSTEAAESARIQRRASTSSNATSTSPSRNPRPRL